MEGEGKNAGEDQRMKFHIVSLGCPKALVDSEEITGNLFACGHTMVNHPKKAELLLLNTCAFLKTAVEESIDAVLELAEYKIKGKCKYLVMCGCLPKRYGRELTNNLPEVDAFVNAGEIKKLREILLDLESNSKKGCRLSGNLQGNKLLENNILLQNKLLENHYRYIKISEGCNHSCSFCIIPAIRGKYKSRPMEEIVNEARELAEKGAKELIIVAQDSTFYGVDLYGKQMLHKLLQKLALLDKVKWIRLLYAYPNQVTNELLTVMSQEEKICKYIDIPFQHSSKRILAQMKRGGSLEILKRLIKLIREKVSGLAIRTSFIVGFPGETRGEFEELVKFVKEMQFERMGVFTYSREEGTEAEKIKNQIHWKTKEHRYNTLMSIQSEISYHKNKKLVGQVLPVILDKKINKNLFAGRTPFDAPQIDQNIYVKSNYGFNDLKPGDILNVLITDCKPYDLVGTHNIFQV